MLSRKSIMNQVIGVFILVLVISVIAGMTFLFTAQLKDTSGDMDISRKTTTVINETLLSNVTDGTPVVFSNSTIYDVICTLTSVTAQNSTGQWQVGVVAANYTQDNCNIAAVTATFNDSSWNVSYTANYIDSVAWSAINDTEAAGATVIDYLPLLFLAIIFGVILIVVLRVLLPFINLGGQMNAGF